MRISDWSSDVCSSDLGRSQGKSARLPPLLQQHGNRTIPHSMPFLELTVPCRESEQPRYEHALEDVGALAVPQPDANADTDNEHAIPQPGVGHKPRVDANELTPPHPHCTHAPHL